MRSSILALAVGAVFVAGCSSEPAAPSNALIGQWGGNRVELVSEANRVTVRFPCGALVGNGALVINADGEFSHSLRSANPPSSETLSLEGTVAGDVITFDLMANTANGSAGISFVVTRNVAPDFSGVVCASSDSKAP